MSAEHAASKPGSNRSGEQQELPIGGLNEVQVKADALCVLSAIEYKISNNNGIKFEAGQKYPLLAVGEYELGKVAAFTSDVAPHWVGPLVDWGNERIKAMADNSETVEFGNYYAKFFANLIQWLCMKKYETVSLIEEI